MKLKFQNLFLLTILTGFVVCPVIGKEQPRSCMASRTDKPPVLDGRLDEQCWQRSTFYTDFVRVFAKRVRAEPNVRFRLLYDEKALYLGIEVEEPHIQRLSRRYRQRDEPVYADDCIEIVLQPAKKSFYYHFVANSLGTRYDAMEGGYYENSAEWNGEWQASATTDEKAWYLEISIPFASIDAKPKPGEIWGFNLCRNRQAGGETEYSAWSPGYQGFHNPEGRLRFGQALAASHLATRPHTSTHPYIQSPIAPLLPLPTEGILFYAPYDGDVTASIARGSGAGTVLGEISYVKGVKGQALVVESQPARGVSYNLKGNFQAKEGSVSLWLMPIDWRFDDRKFHHFLKFLFPKEAAGGGKNDWTLVLYKYLEGLGLLFALFKEGAGWQLGCKHLEENMSAWVPQRWHHVVGVWQKLREPPRTLELRLYVDGELMSIEDGNFELFEEGMLTVGAAWGNEGKTAIDELIIFSHALTLEEINRLYGDGRRRLNVR